MYIWRPWITLLKILDVIGCPIGFKSYEYAIQKDKEKIAVAEKVTKATSKKVYFSKKAAEQEEGQKYTHSEVLLYDPGIADLPIVTVKELYFFWKKYYLNEK